MNNLQVEDHIARLHTASGKVRRDAAKELAKVTDPSATNALIAALDDEDTYVRRYAAEALGKMGKVSTSPALIIEALKRAMSDENWFVHERAAEALAEIGVAAIPALTRALQNCKDNVRFSAAIGLGTIGDVCGVPGLLQALSDRNEHVGNKAAEALGRIGGADILPRKILSHPNFSTQERIELLNRLRRARYLRNGTTTRYNFPDTRTLCQTILREVDSECSAGARAVFNWLDGGTILVRGSQKDRGDGARELLRGSLGGPVESLPETLLIPAEEPKELKGNAHTGR